MENQEKEIWILEYIQKKHPVLPKYEEIESEALSKKVVVNNDEFYSVLNGIYSRGLVSGIIVDKNGWFTELNKLPAWNRKTHELSLQNTSSGRVYLELKTDTNSIEEQIQKVQESVKEVQSIRAEIRSNNVKMVEVLGVFSAIISLVVVGSTIIPSDKLPTYQYTWEAFFFVLAIIGPFGLLLSLLIVLIWLFILPHKKKEDD